VIAGVQVFQRHALLDLELARSEAVLVEVADGADTSSLIDLCLGLVALSPL